MCCGKSENFISGNIRCSALEYIVRTNRPPGTMQQMTNLICHVLPARSQDHWQGLCGLALASYLKLGAGLESANKVKHSVAQRGLWSANNSDTSHKHRRRSQKRSRPLSEALPPEMANMKGIPESLVVLTQFIFRESARNKIKTFQSSGITFTRHTPRHITNSRPESPVMRTPSTSEGTKQIVPPELSVIFTQFTNQGTS